MTSYFDIFTFFEVADRFLVSGEYFLRSKILFQKIETDMLIRTLLLLFSAVQ